MTFTYTFYPVESQAQMERQKERREQQDKQEAERQRFEKEHNIFTAFVMQYHKSNKPPKGLKKHGDLTGLQFGKLCVVGRMTGEHSYCDGHRWRCRCICGGYREVWAAALLCGRVLDCGCRKRWAKRRQRSRLKKAKKERLALAA